PALGPETRVSRLRMLSVMPSARYSSSELAGEQEKGSTASESIGPEVVERWRAWGRVGASASGARSGAARRSTASSASRNSPAVAKRSVGDLDSAIVRICWTDWGTSGRLSGGGGWTRCCTSSEAIVFPLKGGSPVSTSYSTQARAYSSLRPSTWSPQPC